MDLKMFEEFFAKFKNASTDDKINMYCTTENLTKEQYKTMLRAFMPSEIKKLEIALG